MRLSYDWPCRICRLTFTLLMTFAWTGGIAGSALAQEQPANAAEQAAAETPEQVVAHMERVFAALEAVDRAAPRDTFDLSVVLQQVGRDPGKLFAWVRDNTSVIPYQGVLRGPTGVMMDRVGNSLDRALLLADLLRLAGQEVRLARATLSDDQVNQVAGRLRPVAPRQAPIEPMPAEQGEEYAAAFGLDAQALLSGAQEADVRGARMAEESARRVTEQAPLLSAAVGKPAADAGATGSDLSALSDHWWVQRKDGEQWVDLDPLTSDAAPGAAVAPATETIPVGPHGALASLDGQPMHEVVLRIVVEQWRDGAVKQTPVLTHTLRPAELLGQRVALVHQPLKLPDPAPRAADAGAWAKKTLSEQEEWVPQLAIGPARISDSSFTDTGEVKETPNLDPAQQLGGQTGGLFGGLGGGLGGGDESAEDGAQLTAEWLEYEIRIPGEEPRTIRREVFDLIGPAARAGNALADVKVSDDQRVRRALSLTGEIEMLVTGPQLSPEYVSHLRVQSVLSNRQALLGLVTIDERKNDFATFATQVTQVAPPPGVLHTLAVARHQFGPHAADVYLDRPSVFAHHRHYATDDKGNLTSISGIDIVANDIAVRRGAEADPFQVRLVQGVLDTNLEAAVLEQEGEITENTGELFAAAQAQGVEWKPIRRPDELTSLNAEALPPDVMARVKQDLADGYVVVVPTAPVQLAGRPSVAWWRVDPGTGSVLGMGSKGWGQGMTEKQITDNWVLFAKTQWAVVQGGTCFFLSGAQSNIRAASCCALSMFGSLVSAGFAGMTGAMLSGGMSFSSMLCSRL